MVFPGRHQEMLDMGSDLVLFSILFSFERLHDLLGNKPIVRFEVNLFLIAFLPRKFQS